jgi:hypothetical protein
MTLVREMTVAPVKLKDRSRQYRELAAETRAFARSMTLENTREAMLEAASVGDRLAEIAERQVDKGSIRRRAGLTGLHN